jgi:hypothetical protein
MILEALGVVGATLAWAGYAYVGMERRHRPAWRAPDDRTGKPPYRTASDRAPASVAPKAPALVRLTAFACIWLGPLAALLMILPVAFLAPRGRLMLVGGGPRLRHAETADYVRQVAPLLLARDRKVPFACDAVTPLLRVLAASLVGLGGLFLMLEKPVAAAIFAALGVPMGAVYGLLHATRARWPDPEPALEDLAAESEARRAAFEAEWAAAAAAAAVVAQREARRTQLRDAPRRAGSASIACGACGELTDAAELVLREGRRICVACDEE